jgi:hypothetical protein
VRCGDRRRARFNAAITHSSPRWLGHCSWLDLRGGRGTAQLAAAAIAFAVDTASAAIIILGSSAILMAIATWLGWMRLKAESTSCLRRFAGQAPSWS